MFEALLFIALFCSAAANIASGCSNRRLRRVIGLKSETIGLKDHMIEIQKQEIAFLEGKLGECQQKVFALESKVQQLS